MAEVVINTVALLCWAASLFFVIKASQHTVSGKANRMLIPVWIFQKSLFSPRGNRYRHGALLLFVLGLTLIAIYSLLKTP